MALLALLCFLIVVAVTLIAAAPERESRGPAWMTALLLAALVLTCSISAVGFALSVMPEISHLISGGSGAFGAWLVHRKLSLVRSYHVLAFSLTAHSLALYCLNWFSLAISTAKFSSTSALFMAAIRRAFSEPESQYTLFSTGAAISGALVAFAMLRRSRQEGRKAEA
jgi:hypothetical protein